MKLARLALFLALALLAPLGARAQMFAGSSFTVVSSCPAPADLYVPGQVGQGGARAAIDYKGTVCTGATLQLPTAAAGKINSVIRPLPANTSTAIADANANRIALTIQCGKSDGSSVATVVSETGATLAAATFGTTGQTAFLPTSTTAPIFTPPIATLTAITARSADGTQNCAVTEYLR